MSTELTLRQRKFIDAYLGMCNGNATAAAREAGYVGNGVTLRSTAHEVLTNPNVRAEIERELALRTPNPEETLARLGDIARGTLDDFIQVDDVDGQYWRLDIAKAKQAAKLGLLKKLKTGRQGLEIQLHDPLRALELLGKYHKLWSDGATIDARQLTVILGGLPDGVRERVVEQLASALRAGDSTPGR